MHKLYTLARTFHALADCPAHGEYIAKGGAPYDNPEDFDAPAFAEWAAERNMGGGGTWAALFILSVWNDRTDWTAHGLDAPRQHPSLRGRFYMHDALGTWDLPHRAAFHAWTANPWWC